MRTKILLGGLLIGLLSGCVGEDAADTPSPSNSQETANSETEVLAENLEVPWSIDQHEETFYISERPGTIAAITDGALERQQVVLEQSLSSASEAGLLGFVLQPDFSDSNAAFAYYTYEAGNQRMNRIVELELVEEQWEETAVLLDEIPSGSTHHGGRLKIGPDQKLYATTGDASRPETAQDQDSLAGKILRLNLDGSIPEDNPSSDSPVFSYGHRNAQGLTWTSENAMYASEHGASANDEINRIEAGKNYGWPVIEGMETEDGMETPIFTSGSNDTWAPSGMDVAGNALYVAGLRGNTLLRFDLAEDSETQIIEGFGRIRDVYIDGNDLYFVTNNRDGRGSPSEQDDQLVKMSLSSIEQ
ncbi:dehydrogenase [Enterococcus florum]|uniref:Dehydrogenase n=1 Tax=Enterococcus florum TaxID=2480627 RepID=A0A4P5PB05_9ENTE|nr:PQQ-dependent sugar dehydrogenase [Enterococcus florum]GCF95307.1 dehydrogenase [Enterococcus florum]